MSEQQRPYQCQRRGFSWAEWTDFKGRFGSFETARTAVRVKNDSLNKSIYHWRIIDMRDNRVVWESPNQHLW
jgi:hypothetical protein